MQICESELREDEAERVPKFRAQGQCWTSVWASVSAILRGKCWGRGAVIDIGVGGFKGRKCED